MSPPDDLQSHLATFRGSDVEAPCEPARKPFQSTGLIIDQENAPIHYLCHSRTTALARAVEARVANGASPHQAIDALAERAGELERQYLRALRAQNAHLEQAERRQLRVRELQPRMTLEGDVMTRDGTLVLPKGHELSSVLIERLLQFAASRGLLEPILVRVPHPDTR